MTKNLNHNELGNCETGTRHLQPQCLPTTRALMNRKYNFLTQVSLPYLVGMLAVAKERPWQ